MIITIYRLQHYDKTIKRKIFTLQSNLKSLIFTDYSPKLAMQEENHHYLTCKILFIFFYTSVEQYQRLNNLVITIGINYSY